MHACCRAAPRCRHDRRSERLMPVRAVERGRLNGGRPATNDAQAQVRRQESAQPIASTARCRGCMSRDAGALRRHTGE